jgi:hypothetical protein
MFRDNVKSGKGMEFYTDGSLYYMGSLVNGKKFGHGIALYEPDLTHYYVGSWKDNLLVTFFLNIMVTKNGPKMCRVEF